MKSVLEVNSDGLIYVIKDCPEEPKVDETQLWDSFYESGVIQRKKDYQQALASCERILCADQEQAKEIIFHELYGGPRVDIPWSVVARNYSDKIFAIPNVKWEVKDEPIERDASTFSHYEREAGKQLATEFRKVAILKAELKESTPSTEQESQEELTALDLKMFIEHELGGYKTVHMGRSYRVINRQFVYESDIMSLAEDLLRNFTITRKK